MIGEPHRASVIARTARADYGQWLAHTESVHGCVRPIRLYGQIHTVDATTGAVLNTRSTRAMPDEVVYTPCGDRRASVCPACAERYRADTYHLIRSGLVGGKGIPETVATHPAVFTTLTAPSFGPVHTRVIGTNGQVKPCRIRRGSTICPHGRFLSCTQRHTENAPSLGRPLCADCYDYPAHAIWNAFASELWRRTIGVKLRRLVTQLGRARGVTLDINFGKVAEYQHRGIIHFHAIIRLDQLDPNTPGIVYPPPADITAADLDTLITEAATTTRFRTPPHPGNQHTPPRPQGWTVTWGEQLVNRPLARVGSGEITENAVAGYVAKYATKSTETTGFTTRRLTSDTIHLVATPDTHTGRLVTACWDLGANPHDTGKPDGHGNPFHPDTNRPITPERHHFTETYGRLRRWAHMLGFGGHFTSQSQRYGPRRSHLKTIRRNYQRSHQPHTATYRTADHRDDDTTLIINNLTYAGIGWLTSGDAELAITAATKAREYHHIAHEERTTSNAA